MECVFPKGFAMRRFVSLICLIFGVSVFAGCAGSAGLSSSAEASTPVNENCPIMGHAVSADGGTTEWDGKTIGFCCEGCIEKWSNLTETEKADKLAAADQSEH